MNINLSTFLGLKNMILNRPNFLSGQAILPRKPISFKTKIFSNIFEQSSPPCQKLLSFRSTMHRMIGKESSSSIKKHNLLLCDSL